MLRTLLALTVAWTGFAPEQQDRLLAGVAEGYQAAGVELAISDPTRAAAFQARHDYILAHRPALRAALTRFYHDRGHAGVPLARAVRYCCAVALEEREPERWLQDLAAVPRLGSLSGRIPQAMPFLKDPSFVAGGEEIAGKRYVIYGDLERFYLHAFTIAPDGALRFDPTPTPVKLEGLDPKLDGVWAPAVYLRGKELVLLYCAGSQNPDIVWPSFRLHWAVGTRPDAFREQGAIFPDLAPFPDQDFGVIDPVRWVAPSGQAYMSYTVVRYGVPGKRYHEEAVHVRPIDAQDPSKPAGPDRMLYAGLPNTPDDGVAEASDLVTLGGRPFAFISSRAGDKDQRVLVAPMTEDAGTLPAGALKPLLDPGGADWKAAAVGSTSAATFGGRTYMVYQGMDRAARFTLGWTTLNVPSLK